MQITLNGESREVAEGTTISGLVTLLRLERARLAVEHNRRIVPVAERAAARLCAGDQVELVTFVGGG